MPILNNSINFGKTITLKSNLCRIIFFYLIFILAIRNYKYIYNIVGYMFTFEMNYSYVNLFISLLLLLILILIGSTIKKITNIYYDLLIITLFMPISVMLVITGMNFIYVFYPFVSILIIRFIAETKYLSFFENSFINTIKISLFKLFIFFLFFIPFIFLFFDNINQVSFNFLETYLQTYIIRSDVDGSGFIGYYMGWFSFLFYPVLLSTKGRLFYFLNLCLFIASAILFQKYALKVVFFNYILTGLFVIIFKYYEKYNFKFSSSISLFFFLFFFIPYFDENIYPLIDRFFYIIGINSLYYFEYFNINNFRFFENSLIDFGISKTGLPPGLIIDYHFYQGSGTNQSAGFLPTIYADLGIFGIFFGSIIVGFFVRLLLNIFNKDNEFGYLALISFCFLLMNFPLNTIFLSAGGAFYLLFILIQKKNEKKVN